MDFKKLVPWNWFQKEEENTGVTIPVQQSGKELQQSKYYSPVNNLRQEMDQLFYNFFNRSGLSALNTSLTDSLLRPTLDIGASDKEYTITIEVPGVDQKDVKIEVADNVLTVRGEKKQEKEGKEKNYYRIERSYGSFQRVLSLPEDADQDKIKASFKNGVLTVTMPRVALPDSQIKRIEIN